MNCSFLFILSMMNFFQKVWTTLSILKRRAEVLREEEILSCYLWESSPPESPVQSSFFWGGLTGGHAALRLPAAQIARMNSDMSGSGQWCHHRHRHQPLQNEPLVRTSSGRPIRTPCLGAHCIELYVSLILLIRSTRPIDLTSKPTSLTWYSE
jgi:hypothetical protein